MTDLDAVVAGAAACDARGEPWSLATVVSVRGSSYRRPGARLLVPAESEPIGLVSGGCLEGEAASLAREAIRRDVPLLITIDHSQEGDEVWGSGLGCRGILELLAEPPALARQTVDALRAARRDGESAFLLTGLAGERQRLSREAAEALGAPAADAVARGRPARIGDLVLDPILPPPHLLVCGAGPDAAPLVAAATAVGWRVTVADPRRRLLAGAEVEPAARLDVEPAELGRHLADDPVDAVVVMSHDYLRDGAFLAAVAGRGIGYLGVLGPRDRTERMLAELAERGIELGPADRAALHAPAGLDLGADGPHEVALAIVAEILATLRGTSAAPLRERGGPIHPPM